MTSKWTFMVYMAGDNNLSSAGEEDLREMRRVGSLPTTSTWWCSSTMPASTAPSGTEC